MTTDQTTAAVVIIGVAIVIAVVVIAVLAPAALSIVFRPLMDVIARLVDKLPGGSSNDPPTPPA